MVFRIIKILMLSAIAILCLLIVLGNTTDYYTNYHFIEHVMKMDTIFPDSKIHYRAIQEPLIFHLGYILLIALEALMAFSCIKGSMNMIRHVKKSANAFHQSKKWGVVGMGIGILIWFLGFEVIGGEWFAMWQSNTWNGLGSAERILSFLAITLILFYLKEEELFIAEK